MFQKKVLTLEPVLIACLLFLQPGTTFFLTLRVQKGYYHRYFYRNINFAIVSYLKTICIYVDYETYVVTTVVDVVICMLWLFKKQSIIYSLLVTINQNVGKVFNTPGIRLEVLHG